MKARNKYFYFNIGLSKTMNEEVRKECFRLGISKQTLIRSLISDYFLRIHGRDIILESHQMKFKEDTL
jgi:hypothetical protein